MTAAITILLNYKEFKRVSLSTIYKKYGLSNIPETVVRQRIVTYNMGIEEALTKPLRKHSKHYNNENNRWDKMYAKYREGTLKPVVIDTFMRKVNAGIKPEFAIIKGARALHEFRLKHDDTYVPSPDKEYRPEPKIRDNETDKYGPSKKYHPFSHTEIKASCIDLFVSDHFPVVNHGIPEKQWRYHGQ